MKTSRVLLSFLLMTLMTSAFAEETDGQYREHNKREGSTKQQSNQQPSTAIVRQVAAFSRPTHSSIGFSQFPRLPQHSQSHIENAPVGVHPNNTPPIENFQAKNPQFDGNNRWNNNRSEQNRRNRDTDRERHQVVNGGLGSDGYMHGNNTNLSSNGYIRTNQPRIIEQDHLRIIDRRGSDENRYHHGWQERQRFTQYRMPYRQGYTDRYRVQYVQTWPQNYGWRVHGWSRNYREADPYWFAVITSMALAQAWSDAEVAQAINDNNLRQQLIDDEDIRQQMIASGYPAYRVDYPAQEYTDDPNGYPPAGYNNPYDLNNPYPPQNPNTAYDPPPASSNPNSPLYNGASLASGDQIANRNANQNVLFFCNAGNKQKTAEAFRKIQSPDMTVWKTLESFNKCRSWAAFP